MFDRLRGERDSSRVVQAFRRYWWVIVIVAVVAAGGAYVLSNRKPKMYAATSALLFQASHLDNQLFGNQVLSSSDPTRTAATNQGLVGLPAVSSLVAAQLKLPESTVSAAVTVGSDAQSDLLTVTATSRSPRLAAAIANAYVASYISFRRTADQSQLSQAEQLIKTQLAAISPAQQNSSTAQNLRQKSLELQLLASLQTGNAEVVQTASARSSPVSPTPSKDAIIGLVLGLLVGIGLVWALERRDRRIKSISEVEELYGVPIIGTVPESGALRGPGAVGTAREQDAFRMIRAQLRYFDVDRDIKRVVVTSADSGEGKSLISLNLARAAARTDETRALLIEADLRRPSLTAMIGLENVAGLSELLSHSQNLAAGLRELVVSPHEENGAGVPFRFDVLLAGATPPNPVELLESKRMQELMLYAETIYDLVIIDTPPIGVVSDPISLVHQVDGVIVISRLGRSRRDHAVRLMKRLRGLNAHLLGVVVNGCQTSGEGYYGYYGDGGTPGSGVRSPARGRRGRQRDPSRTP
jgi:succinoglycan biosynthesis transport protein ExoP